MFIKDFLKASKFVVLGRDSKKLIEESQAGTADLSTAEIRQNLDDFNQPYSDGKTHIVRAIVDLLSGREAAAREGERILRTRGESPRITQNWR